MIQNQREKQEKRKSHLLNNRTKYKYESVEKGKYKS